MGAVAAGVRAASGTGERRASHCSCDPSSSSSPSSSSTCTREHLLSHCRGTTRCASHQAPSLTVLISLSPSSTGRSSASPLASTRIRSRQPEDASSPAWDSIAALTACAPPPNLPAVPSPPAPATLLRLPPTPPAGMIHPPAADPSEWTLAQIVEHCTTYEEYVLHRPLGFERRGLESWTVMDRRIRTRHRKDSHRTKRKSISEVFEYQRRVEEMNEQV